MYSLETHICCSLKCFIKMYDERKKIKKILKKYIEKLYVLENNLWVLN